MLATPGSASQKATQEAAGSLVHSFGVGFFLLMLCLYDQACKSCSCNTTAVNLSGIFFYFGALVALAL